MRVIHKVRLYALLTGMVLVLCSPSEVRAEEAKFSSEKGYEHVKHLTQKIGPRPAGSKGEQKAAQYISYVLEQYGWQVKLQQFSKFVVQDNSFMPQEQKIKLINSQNIMAELPGKRPDTIVIGAHYDTADTSAPGAVDNASGVGVLLELARILSKEQHDMTYQLVFFGAEEAGLVGSSYYVAQADLSAVNWMLNLDMVGSPLEIDVAGKKSTPPELIEDVVKLARQDKMPFHLSRDFAVMTRDSSQGGASDFSSFLDQGIPSVGFGISGRPSGFYHRPEDKLAKVSLAELQKTGEFVLHLVNTVQLEHSGPSTWDEHYLTFQIGSYVLVLSSIGLTTLFILTFFITGLNIVRALGKLAELRWRSYFAMLGVALGVSLLAVVASGLGELIWCAAKGVEAPWYAYPEVFLIIRLLVAFCAIALIGSFLPHLPMSRASDGYWLLGALMLLGVSILTALIRVDLAFPFVFWLLIFNIQFYVPRLFLVWVGPYFLYYWHWELLNSQQWQSFYQATHQYYLLFASIYGLLLTPVVLGALQVVNRRTLNWAKILYLSRRPVIVTVVIAVLALGLIPSHSASYPQIVSVKEEWLGDDDGRLHIYSQEKLPKKLQENLHAPPGKSVVLPSINQTAPAIIKVTIAERTGQDRVLDIGLGLSYSKEPYLVRITLESSRPFQIIQLDEFLPVSKLPRKVKLQGKENLSGKYSLVMERTPPQRNTVRMSLRAESTVKCTVEAILPESSPNFQIHETNLSVDYQILIKKEYEL